MPMAPSWAAGSLYWVWTLILSPEEKASQVVKSDTDPMYASSRARRLSVCWMTSWTKRSALFVEVQVEGADRQTCPPDEVLDAQGRPAVGGDDLACGIE